MASAALAFVETNPIHPDLYVARGYPHDIWKRLRREDPVHWHTETAGEPFWAVTKHDDITHVGRHPRLFGNSPLLVLSHEPDRGRIDDIFPPTLIDLDPPKHQAYRDILSRRFTPRGIRFMHDDIEAIGKEIVDDLVKDTNEGECDFVREVSAPLPIAVIAWMLGVPKSDWRMLFDWTNRMIGSGDPEYIDEGKTQEETARSAGIELFQYFSALVEEKRKNPKDDLVTLFTRAEVDGKPLEPMDILSFCLIIVVAGNETTRNATTGGMLALIEHQDQLRKLQGDMSLLKSGVEEILRWTSPIIHFARTAMEDTELRGRRIEKGQRLGLFYPSANRDEDVFEDPYAFRVGRQPNRHLAFGVGEHFCLGAHVARLEMYVAYKHLLPRIQEIELTGPPDRLRSALVGGIKHLPIRYKLQATS